MKNFKRNIDNQNSKNAFWLFVFLLVFNFSSFGQSTASTSNAILNGEGNQIQKSEDRGNSKIASEVEFLLWFMGSKQDPNSLKSNDKINTRRGIITSGFAPNRILLKAFLKKVVNCEKSVA